MRFSGVKLGLKIISHYTDPLREQQPGAGYINSGHKDGEKWKKSEIEGGRGRARGGWMNIRLSCRTGWKVHDWRFLPPGCDFWRSNKCNKKWELRRKYNSSSAEISEQNLNPQLSFISVLTPAEVLDRVTKAAWRALLTPVSPVQHCKELYLNASFLR